MNQRDHPLERTCGSTKSTAAAGLWRPSNRMVVNPGDLPAGDGQAVGRLTAPPPDLDEKEASWRAGMALLLPRESGSGAPDPLGTKRILVPKSTDIRRHPRLSERLDSRLHGRSTA